MQFTSLAFAIFMPIVFFLYWAAPNKYRMPLLLLVSYLFYATFQPWFVVLLLMVSLITYGMALVGRKSRVAFTTGVIFQLGLLCFFKYAGFLPGIGESIVVPVGISFYIFKAVSYLADVRMGKQQAVKNPVEVLAYLAFFPDLVSGPINRASTLIPQLRDDKVFQYDQAAYGMRLILLGLCKKMLIADTLARYVNPVFEQPGSYMGITYLVVSLFYTIEIYCDFSGYSDMAIGIARLFGVVSMENFKSPYFACNIREFWDRWHISLSSWLRDYVYFPLGGSRKGKVKTYFNLMITFLVSGIWHGASLTFLFWGALHGLYQMLYRFWKEHVKWKMPKVLAVLLTFCAVSFAWIFFRADSFADAWMFLRYMWYDLSPKLAYLKLGMNKRDFFLIVVSVLLLAVYDWRSIRMDVLASMKSWKAPLRWIIYLSLAGAIIAFHIHGGSTQQFIYFQF